MCINNIAFVLFLVANQITKYSVLSQTAFHIRIFEVVWPKCAQVM